MLNFEKELEKFQPSMDVEQVEDVVYNNNLADVTDIIKELIQNIVSRFYENDIDVLKYLCHESNNIAVRIHTAIQYKQFPK